MTAEEWDVTNAGEYLPLDGYAWFQERLRHLGRDDAPLYEMLEGLSMLLYELATAERIRRFGSRAQREE